MYSESEARELVIKAGLELVEKKLIARTWGNISARISDNEFIITPSGRTYDSLATEDLVKVRINSLEYDGFVKPSSEKGVHAAVYALRSDCSFIIHTHQFYASAICAEGKETAFAPCARYGVSGSKVLAKNVTAVVSSNPYFKSFLMEKHGALVAGNDYSDAFDLIEKLEEQCRLLFEDRKHAPRPGAWIDDYAQMFDSKGIPNPGEDADAVAYVKAKNEAAASYASTSRPLSPLIAALEHIVYTKKYSQLAKADK